MAQVGLKNIYYAKMESDTSSATTYATPEKIGHAISVEINIEEETASLYGDDAERDTYHQFKKATVTIGTTDIPLKDEAIILGHKYDSDTSTLIASGNDSAPYVALLFESDKQDGSTRCVKLLKGKFAPTQEGYNTRGATFDYQTPSLEGTFIVRESDNQWKMVRDFAKGSNTSTWYTSV